MKIEIKNLPKSEAEMEIEISAESFQEFLEKAVSILSKSIELKGFRKGKIPKEMAKKTLGSERILAEATSLAVRETFQKAVKEKDLEVISEPQVEIQKMAEGNPFIFKAKFSLLPQVELPDYKKAASQVKGKKVEVKDNELENALKWLQKSRSKLSAKTGPAQKGDFVEIEYKSPYLEKPEIDAFILGEGQFLPGFEKVLFNSKAGDKKEQVSVKFPQDYFRKELAGKEIKVNLKINSVKKVEIPELTDEFVKNLGQFENLEDLKKNIKEGIKMEKEQAESQRVRAEVLEKIGEKVKVEIPEALVEREEERMIENLKAHLSEKVGISFQDYLKKAKKTEGELKKSFLPQAQKRIKDFLILRAIGKKENIEVREEDVKERVEHILSHYSSSDRTQQELDPERLKAYTKEVIFNEKIFDLLEKSTL